MVTINGVDMDDPMWGVWVMRSTSRKPDLSREREALRVAGRDGVVAGLPSTMEAGTRRYVVECPPQREEALLALVGDGGVIEEGAREAVYETVSAVSRELDTFSPRVEISFTLRLPGVFWRDKTLSSPSFPVSGASTVVTFWSGISAPVQDALVRMTGPYSDVTITDGSGAWVSLPECSAGQSVVFRSDDGTAGRNSNGSWSLSTDVSGAVDFGGPRAGWFEITPFMPGAEPATRTARLTVTGSIGSGASFAVRGKSAYLL